MPVNRVTAYQLKYARAVIAAGRLYADDIVTNIQTRWGADAIVPERTRAELLGFCDLLARTTEEFEAQEAAVAKDLADDIEARAERDQAFAELSELLVAVRSRVRESLGQVSLRLYRLDERSPNGYEALGRYVGDVLVMLEQSPRTGETALGEVVDTAALAAAVSAALTRYRAALDTVAREARETETVRNARREHEARFRRVLVSVAMFLEHYLRLAGDDALADRVRPTRGRAGGEGDLELPSDGEPLPGEGDDEPVPDEGDGEPLPDEGDGEPLPDEGDDGDDPVAALR
ncbi:hypothetical protein [Haliangium sp.]|uniref:hypothetical protein n=1 Tax=Haliangium sp. TaxID=2663208 RepID=UPI003D0CC9EC